MGKELKPCPFCGGEARLNDAEAGTTQGRFTLPESARKPYCTRCGCDLGYFDTPQQALAAWNRRTKPRPAPESGRRWTAAEDFKIAAPYRGTGYDELIATFIQTDQRDRAVSCVNALAGISEPEKAVASAREALRVLARKEIPAKPQGNAGAYSILHSEIMAARTALAALGEGE